MTISNKNSKTKKQKKTMEKENNSIWSKILKIVITVLTAVATTFGIQACGGGL